MPSYRRLKAVGIAGLITVLLSSLTMGAFAENSETGDPGDPIVQGEEEALQHDAEVYAENFDVDVETAKQNLQLQRPAGELQAELYENEADTYAGQWLDHGGDLRLIVWFTDGDAERLQQYDPSDTLSDVIEVRKAEYSWAELREQQKEAVELIAKTSVEFNAEVNIKENQAEIWVTDDEELQEVLSETGRQFPDEVQIVEVKELATDDVDSTVASDRNHNASSLPATHGPDVYGGLDLEPGCTTGFAVEHSSGARGFVSAGHCQSTLQAPPGNWWYHDPSQTTPLQDYWHSYQLDVQWHTTPHHTLRNWVMVSAHPFNTRTITGEVPHLQQSLGEWVCVFGAVTNSQRCGQIQTIDHRPGAPNSCSCFVRVSDPSGGNLTVDGDSGAPWYSGNDAYGVHKASVAGNDASYMPISTASGVPELSLLTWCPSGGC